MKLVQLARHATGVAELPQRFGRGGAALQPRFFQLGAPAFEVIAQFVLDIVRAIRSETNGRFHLQMKINAVDADDWSKLGYAAGTLRPTGCVIGPVFTRPDARRRGVGESLVRAIQEWATATRVPVVEISVAADNPAGLAFLESLGYVPRRILMSLTPSTDQGDAP